MTEEQFKALELDAVYYLWVNDGSIEVHSGFYHCHLSPETTWTDVVLSKPGHTGVFTINNLNSIIDFKKIDTPSETDFVKETRQKIKQSRIDQINKQINDLKFERNELEYGG